MKNFLFILSVGTTLFYYSCSGKKEESGGGISDKAKANIAASQAIIDAFLTGDISKIDSFVSSDFIDHTDKGDMGRDSLKAMITMMHNMVKDQKSETMRVLADDDYVFSWMRYTGTSDGSLGMPAGAYDMVAIEVAKFRDSKAIEHWNFMEVREMMKMMGGSPPPTAMDEKIKPAKDSESK